MAKKWVCLADQNAEDIICKKAQTEKEATEIANKATDLWSVAETVEEALKLIFDYNKQYDEENELVEEEFERVFRVISESEVYNRTKDKHENLKLNDEYVVLREDVYLGEAGAWKCKNVKTKDIVLIPHWYCYNSIQEINPAEEILKKLMALDGFGPWEDDSFARDELSKNCGYYLQVIREAANIDVDIDVSSDEYNYLKSLEKQVK